MDQEVLFNGVFIAFLRNTAAIKDQGKYDDALKLLSVGLEDSKSCYECWLLQLCAICWKNEQNFKSRHGAVCIETDKKCFQDLLREEQGVPASKIGCFLELSTICNILSLEMMGTSPGSPTVKTKLSKETQKQLIVSLERVGSIIAPTNLFDQKPHSSHNPFQDISFKAIKEELLNILKSMGDSKTTCDPSLAFCVSLVTEYVLLAEFSRKDDLTETLANENSKLAKRIKDTHELTTLASSSLILHVNTLDLQYHSMLFSSYINLVCGDNEITLKLLGEMETEKFPGNLHLLLKALVFFCEEDYAQCDSFARAICSQLESERLRKDDLLLSITWNLVGVCFLMMKKPNIAVRVFDQSFKACSEYQAALRNLITSLKISKQEEARIRCLQLALQVTESSSKSKSSLLQQLPDFQNIFLSKLCFEYLSRYKEIKVPSSNELVYLDLPQVDRSELLEELADTLYQERRLKEASDVYLNLIRTIRNETSNTAPTRRPGIVHIFHKTVDTLLKSGRLQNAQTVCDYLLRLTTSNQGIISSQQLGRLIDLDEDVVALLYKSEILRQLGDHEEAIACLTRIINAFEDSDIVKQPQQKRPRIEESSSIREENQPRVEIEKLKVMIYNNLGVTLLEVKNTKGSFTAFQNSIKFSPEKIEEKILFNYCKLLLESKQHAAAMKNWNDTKNAQETLGSLERLLTDNYKIMLWMDVMR